MHIIVLCFIWYFINKEINSLNMCINVKVCWTMECWRMRIDSMHGFPSINTWSHSAGEITKLEQSLVFIRGAKMAANLTIGIPKRKPMPKYKAHHKQYQEVPQITLNRYCKSQRRRCANWFTRSDKCSKSYRFNVYNSRLRNAIYPHGIGLPSLIVIEKMVT